MIRGRIIIGRCCRVGVMLVHILFLFSGLVAAEACVKEERVKYPDGYLSSFYDAFHQINFGSKKGLSPKGFDRLVKLYPDSVEAHIMRAYAYLRFGNTAEARRSIDRSIELDSTNAESYAMRVEIMNMQGEAYDKIFKDELKCVELDPNNTSYVHRVLFRTHDMKMYDSCISFSLKNYEKHNLGGLIDVLLSSCYVNKLDRQKTEEHLRRFVAREDSSPALSGFALFPAAVINDSLLFETIYSRVKEGGCVSIRDLMCYQGYMRSVGRLDVVFREGISMVLQCDYDSNDIEQMIQSLGIVGIMDSVTMSVGLRFTDLLLSRYSRSDVVLGFAEMMYRKVNDNGRTHELLLRTAQKDSSNFLRWALLMEFENSHRKVGGQWVKRTVEDWQNASQTFPLSQWLELTETHRYMMRKFPHEIVASQYLSMLYSVTQSREVVRDTAYRYVSYYQGRLKRHKKTDTIYYSGSSWEQQLPASRAYKKTISSLYSYVGDLYMYKDMRELAYAEYEKGLKYNGDNAMLLNNYAYYLAKFSDKKHLKKAEKMSKRSIALEPKNPTYLDTYAYILYLNGDYTRAKSYYAKLFTLGGGNLSAEVYRNYSELLDALGNKSAAEVYRMKAESLEKQKQ